MKENNDIDKLLRASLDSYRPAPAPSGKERFLEEAASIMPGKARRGGYWLPISTAIVFLAITGGLVWYFASAPDSDLTAPSTISNNEVTAPYSQNKPSENSTVIKEKSNIETSNDSQQSAVGSRQSTVSSQQSAVGSRQSAVGSQQDEPVATTQEEATALNNEKVSSQQSAVGSRQLAIGNMEPGTLEPETLEPGTLEPETVSSQNPDTNQNSKLIPPAGAQNSKFQQGRSMYSLFYKTEYLFNTNEKEKMVNSLGIEYQFRPFHPSLAMRVGAGISLSPGNYNYGIDYNEYMGSYLHLDSVSFSLAADNFHLETTYHQTEKTVYDTALQTEYLSTDKRFVYLYVPVMLGYDFIRTEKLTFGFRAGPALSVLLNQKAAMPDYDAGQNQLVGVNLLTPQREILNWQVMGGLNVTFISKNDYFLEIEPAFSWYLNQPAGNEGSRKYPYSLGIRLAIGILPEDRVK
jgi:cytoskeletal protein RodZ